MATCYPEPDDAHVQLDSLPGFWDQNAAFVANLLGLFFDNDEQTQMLANEVGEMDSYGGRLLPILDLLYAGPENNLLVLESKPDPALSRYFTDTLGLSLPEVTILPHGDYLNMGEQLAAGGKVDISAYRKIGEHVAARLDGYVTDATLVQLADRLGMPTISSHEGSRFGNNKWQLHTFLEQRGLPTPATEIATGPDDIGRCLAALESAGYVSAVIKAPMGASGIGLIKVPSLADRTGRQAAVPDHFFSEGPCLVQGWISPGERGVRNLYSPSAQLFLNDDSVVIYDLTEQILSDDSVHEGNVSPPPYLEKYPGAKRELLRQAKVAGKWLHRRGYRGTASADFLLAENDNGSFTVYVCELNARVTGATYPAVLARHLLPSGCWLLRNLRFTEPVQGGKLLQLLERSHGLFVNGKSEAGILPVNFNTGSDGLVHKGQFLCLAPSCETSKLLLKMAQTLLPCHPDRD